MPITKSAKKALRGSVRKKVFNDRKKRAIKSVLKEIGKSSASKDKKQAESLLSQAYKAIDKATKTGVIKKNTANRKKSRLVKAINKIA